MSGSRTLCVVNTRRTLAKYEHQSRDRTDFEGFDLMDEGAVEGPNQIVSQLANRLARRAS